MKNVLLVWVIFFFTTPCLHSLAQVSLPHKDRFSHGASVGGCEVRYLINTTFEFGDEKRSAFKSINSTGSLDWTVAYNVEYRNNKKFSVRSQVEFSAHKTTLQLKEFSGTERQYDFGSIDLGVPIHLIYRVGNKKWHPIVFMGFRTILLNEIGKDAALINLSMSESGYEVGFGAEFKLHKYLIRPEVSLYNGLNYWVNEEYLTSKRVFRSMSRDIVSFRLVLMQRKG